MKLALDLDGVVCDNHKVWIARLSESLGRTILHEHITEYDFENCLGITRAEVFKHYTRDMYDTTPPVEGAVEAIKEIYRMTNYQPIVILTKCGPTFDNVKMAWVKHHFPKIRFEFLFCRHSEAKSDYLEHAGCDVFVDDYEKNFDGVKCECILFDQPWNRHVTNYVRAVGWPQVLTMIQENLRRVNSAVE